jgi:thiol-disulfide isomerase/thioredoxin
MTRLFRWLAAVVLVYGASGCQAPVAFTAPETSSAAAPATVTSAPAELAPDFALTTLDGEPVTLTGLRGRWVLINFWATWCAPCRDEMPYLNELAAAHADKLTVLAVNMRESPEAVAPFVAELAIDLPVLLAPDDATLLAYNVRGLPLSILVAPDGTIVRRIAGPVQPADLDAIW